MWITFGDVNFRISLLSVIICADVCPFPTYIGISWSQLSNILNFFLIVYIGLTFIGTYLVDLLDGSPLIGLLTPSTGLRDWLYLLMWSCSSGFLNSCMIKALSARCWRLKLLRSSGRVNFLSMPEFIMKSSWLKGCTDWGVWVSLRLFRRKSRDQFALCYLSSYVHCFSLGLFVFYMDILPVGFCCRMGICND